MNDKLRQTVKTGSTTLIQRERFPCNLKHSVLMKVKPQEHNFITVQSLLSSRTWGKNWIQSSKTRSLTLIYVLKVLPCLPRSWLWSYISAIYTWTGRKGRAMLSTHKLLQLINKSCQQRFHFNLVVKHFNSLWSMQLSIKGKIIFLSLSRGEKHIELILVS